MNIHINKKVQKSSGKDITNGAICTICTKTALRLHFPCLTVIKSS